jgi:hypothetical protein
MDINLLVLNLGNSRLGIGAFAAGNLEYVARIGNEHRMRGRTRSPKHGPGSAMRNRPAWRRPA